MVPLAHIRALGMALSLCWSICRSMLSEQSLQGCSGVWTDRGWGPEEMVDIVT